jgi:tRNA/rRNA methyltransferase
LADQRALQGFLEHLERSLLAIGFLDPAHPKKLMARMRRLFLRARLRTEEVDLLRGICNDRQRRAKSGRRNERTSVSRGCGRARLRPSGRCP